jgi:hypothetical protein
MEPAMSTVSASVCSANPSHVESYLVDEGDEWRAREAEMAADLATMPPMAEELERMLRNFARAHKVAVCLTCATDEHITVCLTRWDGDEPTHYHGESLSAVAARIA